MQNCVIEDARAIPVDLVKSFRKRVNLQNRRRCSRKRASQSSPKISQQLEKIRTNINRLQRLHACDEELIRLEEDARVAVHREAEQFLSEIDARKRGTQADMEKDLSARERELHLALLSLEHQRDGYDEDARAKSRRAAAG